MKAEIGAARKFALPSVIFRQRLATAKIHKIVGEEGRERQGESESERYLPIRDRQTNSGRYEHRKSEWGVPHHAVHIVELASGATLSQLASERMIRVGCESASVFHAS